MKWTTILLFITCMACMSGKTSLQPEVTEIRFGNGGGFSGKETSYSLASNGLLKELDKVNGFSKQIAANTVQELMKSARNLDGYDYNKPGNMYAFVEINQKGTLQRIVWDVHNHTVDSKVTELYEALMKQVTE